MFVKLNKKIIVSEYVKNFDVISYADAIKYATVTVPIVDIYSLVPERYRDKFSLLIMEISRPISPHTDSEILSTINIYVEPDNCVTTFYDFNNDTTVTTRKLNNQTNGRLFNKEELLPVNSFIANKDEAWLLDVTKPHSVNTVDHRFVVKRKAIVLQSRYYNYEQVKEMLKETGYI